MRVGSIRRAAHILAFGVVGTLAACGGSSTCDGVGEMCHLAGIGVGQYDPNADGMPAAKAPLYWVSQLRKGPDARTYIMEQNGYRLHAIEADGTLSLVAGNGVHGGFTEGADAQQTALFDPIDFAWRPDGRLVMVLWHDGRLAEIEADGTIHTIFGQSTESNAGSCVTIGDGGPAVDASFCELAAIAIDQMGRIFVADDGAQQIRMIDTNGVVTTIVGADGNSGYDGDGGPAAAAHINIYGMSTGLAVDQSNHLYLADTNNHVIRQIDLSTMTIKTVAGNHQPTFAGDGGPCLQASFRDPGGVAVDTDGTLYVSDAYNNRIRRVDLANDIVTTIAGTGKLGDTGDGKPALEAELHNPARITITDGVLYIADLLNDNARSLRLR